MPAKPITHTEVDESGLTWKVTRVPDGWYSTKRKYSYKRRVLKLNAVSDLPRKSA